MGGDEFALILVDFDRREATTLLERLLDAARLAGDGLARFGSGISIGAADLVEGETADELVARVDRLLYRAKGGGRDQVAWPDEQPPGAAG